MEDDGALVKHGAPHPEPLGRPDVVMKWTSGLLDGNQGAQAVGAGPSLDLSKESSLKG